MGKDEKKSAEEFSGVVNDPFNYRNKDFKVGDTFTSKDKRSIDYLKEIHKLK